MSFSKPSNITCTVVSQDKPHISIHKQPNFLALVKSGGVNEILSSHHKTCKVNFGLVWLNILFPILCKHHELYVMTHNKWIICGKGNREERSILGGNIDPLIFIV